MASILKKYSLLVLFVTFSIVFTLADLFSPTQTFSELENRSLSTRPTFSWSKFVDGKFSSQYEKFINDQFLGRNQWINLKSRGEYVLGKIENNGIIYGKEGYLFEKLQTFNEQTIANNVASIKHFASTYDIPISLALVPNSYVILEDKLPRGAYMLDQNALISGIDDTLADSVTGLNLCPILSDYQDDYIYYRTDHHWTTFGAYLAYSEWVKSLGMEPVQLSDLESRQVEDFYGTYFSKAKSFNAISDTLTYYPMDISVTIDNKPYESLYDATKWEVRDKYAGFLWGNNGVTVIKSPHNMYSNPGKTSKLLVFKDSFGNSLVPFLTYNFDEVHVIDLRALPIKLSDYMAEHEFDQALMLYNVTNFIQDTNIARLKQ
ncbi:MAG: DHHW family protein [Cellulosilyticaceae bacterium]